MFAHGDLRNARNGLVADLMAPRSHRLGRSLEAALSKLHARPRSRLYEKAVLDGSRVRRGGEEGRLASWAWLAAGGHLRRSAGASAFEKGRPGQCPLSQCDLRHAVLRCYGLISRTDRPEGKSSGGCGVAAMSRNLARSRLHHDSVINDRNLRSLAIALATFVIVWVLAYGAVFVSNQISPHSRPLSDGPVPVATIVK
jgi:hypothetical protein